MLRFIGWMLLAIFVFNADFHNAADAFFSWTIFATWTCKGVKNFLDEFERLFCSERAKSIQSSLQIKKDQRYKFEKNIFNKRKVFVNALMEIEDDMIFIFGDSWEKKYKDNGFIGESNSYSTNEGIAYHVYLAYKGYTYDPWLSGYNLKGSGKTVMRKLRGLIIMEKYMKLHRPDLKPEIIICPEEPLGLEEINETKIVHCIARWNFFQVRPTSDENNGAKKLCDLDSKLWNYVEIPQISEDNVLHKNKTSSWEV